MVIKHFYFNYDPYITYFIRCNEIREREEENKYAQKMIVIGGGLGGLSAAMRLAADGHEVTVLEKMNVPG